MKYPLLVSAVVLLLFVILARGLEAQHPAVATLNVSVTDISGAVIPGATIKALAGQEEVAVEQTNKDGKAILTLAPGSYQIRAEDRGFRSEGIQLQVAENSPASHLFRLQPGGGSTVEVIPLGPPFELWTPPLDDVWIPDRRID